MCCVVSLRHVDGADVGQVVHGCNLADRAANGPAGAAIISRDLGYATRDGIPSVEVLSVRTETTVTFDAVPLSFHESAVASSVPLVGTAQVALRDRSELATGTFVASFAECADHSLRLAHRVLAFCSGHDYI